MKTEIKPILSRKKTENFIYGSNCLDGITLSLEQTRSVLDSENTLSATAEILAPDGKQFETSLITKHKLALFETLELAASGIKLSQAHIHKIHETMLGDISLASGEYRECNLKIKGLLIPSRPERLTQRLDGLIDLINNGTRRNVDKNRLAWRVHHEFFTIHPFNEGNGRMARLLLNFIKFRAKRKITVLGLNDLESYGRAIITFQKQKIARMQARKKAQLH